MTAATPRLAATCRALDTALHHRGAAIRQLADTIRRLCDSTRHDPEPATQSNEER